MSEQEKDQNKEVDKETETTATEPAYKKRVSYQGILLGVFATLASALLVAGNIATSETIAQRVAEDLQSSLSQVIPQSQHSNNLLDNQITIKHQDSEIIVYQGIKDHQVTALAYSVTGYGYAGEIKLIMGVSARGEVMGVRVISHAETPGLGDKIEAEKDDWIFSFNGLSFIKLAEDLWKVKKDGGTFDQFSGATITPRAIVKAVKQGLLMFEKHRQQLLTLKVDDSSDKATVVDKPKSVKESDKAEPEVNTDKGNADE